MTYFKVLLLLLIISCSFVNTLARNDTVHFKDCKVLFGVNLSKEVNHSRNYGPKNNTLIGVSGTFNGFIFKVSANYINRKLFEKQNYVLGSRDRRLIPLSGFELGVTYIKGLNENRIIHGMFGINFRKSTLYGGWRNEIRVGNFNFPVDRVVNFEDKFYQLCGIFGIYLSNHNKLGYSLSCPIGINIQNLNNSHIYEKKEVCGSSCHKENIPSGNRVAFYMAFNINLFYNL